MNGTVKKIVKDKGYGFITGADKKDYFFHRSALKNTDLDALKEGDEVEFEDTSGEKGRRAEEVYV